jgi:glutamine amidotransferase
LDGNAKVCILNYGSGNIKSVSNLLHALSADAVVSNAVNDIRSASHLILPGVGAFGPAMEKIKKTIPMDVLEEEVLKKGKPFLGICVGLQVLADKGFEFGEHAGLGWIPGTVERLESGTLPLPHIGWNNIRKKRETPLFKQFPDDQDFYYVHSYAFKPKRDEHLLAVSEYGETFGAVLGRDNIYGVQFHPEKSQKAGKILIQNFLEIL